MHLKFSNTPSSRENARDASASTRNSARAAQPLLTTLGYAEPRFLTANSGFGRLWDPGLLDRLQAPLTRFHD